MPQIKTSLSLSTHSLPLSRLHDGYTHIDACRSPCKMSAQFCKNVRNFHKKLSSFTKTCPQFSTCYTRLDGRMVLCRDAYLKKNIGNFGRYNNTDCRLHLPLAQGRPCDLLSHPHLNPTLPKRVKHSD